MLVEMHMIQNFAPANLNRDDTGAPKDCEFGKVRRARVSSQSWKRAIRERLRADGLLPPADLAVRTKRLHQSLAERLAVLGVGQAGEVALAALRSTGINLAEDGYTVQTGYLLFVGEREIARVARICAEHQAELLATSGKGDGGAASGRRRRAADDLGGQILTAFDGGRAVDLALFGRMVADVPDRNIDAACQMAHAISTHAVETEFDFFTAVDDLKGSDEDAGAGMMGTVEFNSACFYRYFNVDVDQLQANLQGDRALARRGLEAFLHASVRAIPGGKQNSMAAHSPPSLVFAVVRSGGHWPWSLVNAFVDPVRPRGQADLVDGSIDRLGTLWHDLTNAYGADNVVAAKTLRVGAGTVGGDLPGRVDTLTTLVSDVVAAAVPEVA